MTAKTASKPRRRAAAAAPAEVPMTEPRPSTMLELATKIDVALRDVEARRQAVDVARVSLDAATQDYSDAVTTLTTLRTEYQTFMDHVLSVGGTVHVAKP
jgi:hypothetical protein